VTDAPNPADRRRYRRVQAPILVRPASIFSRVVPRRVSDISLGGLRTYSDDPLVIGQRQEIELLFQGGGSATLLVEVAWVETLEADAPAKFECGLRIVNARQQDIDAIAKALGD